MHGRPSTARSRFVVGGGRLRQVAPVHAVAEVNYDADSEPDESDEQASRCRPRQRACQRDKPGPRGGESAS